MAATLMVTLGGGGGISLPPLTLVMSRQSLGRLKARLQRVPDLVT